MLLNIKNLAGRTVMQVSEEKIIDNVESHLIDTATTVPERAVKQPSHPYAALQNAGIPPKQTP